MTTTATTLGPRSSRARAAAPPRRFFALVILLLAVGSGGWWVRDAMRVDVDPHSIAVDVPGGSDYVAERPGPVTIAYDGLEQPVWTELGISVSGPNGSFTPVTVRHHDDRTRRALASSTGLTRTFASFDAPAAGSYRVSASRSVEISARLLIGRDAGSARGSVLTRGFVVLLVAMVTTTTIGASAGVRRPR